MCLLNSKVATREEEEEDVRCACNNGGSYSSSV